ncbi:hypothetical protein [Paraburkholderia sp. SIMBA_054]
MLVIPDKPALLRACAPIKRQTPVALPSESKIAPTLSSVRIVVAGLK